MGVPMNGEVGAGLLKPWPGPASPIPHLFHFIWLGGDPPEEYEEYMQGWVERHPDWNVYLWEDRDMTGLFNQALYDYAQEIAPGYVGQLRCDIARLEAIYNFGGVYVDYDFECLKSIEDLVSPNNPLPSRRRDPVRFFAAWEEQNRWVNNAFFGAEPKHPFVLRLIEGLADNIQKHRQYKPNVMSGPQYLTRMYREWIAEEGDEGIFVLPQNAFYPYGYHELHRKGEGFPYAYAVHHWNNKGRGG